MVPAGEFRHGEGSGRRLITLSIAITAAARLGRLASLTVRLLSFDGGWHFGYYASTYGPVNAVWKMHSLCLSTSVLIIFSKDVAGLLLE